MLIYVFCTSCECEIVFCFDLVEQFQVQQRKSTKNQFSSFGLIEKSMDLSLTLLAVISEGKNIVNLYAGTSTSGVQKHAFRG